MAVEAHGYCGEALWSFQKPTARPDFASPMLGVLAYASAPQRKLRPLATVFRSSLNRRGAEHAELRGVFSFLCDPPRALRLCGYCHETLNSII